MCGQPVDVASTDRLCAAPTTEPETAAGFAANNRAAPGQGTGAAEANHNETPLGIGAAAGVTANRKAPSASPTR
jgi:hypothetical protein